MTREIEYPWCANIPHAARRQTELISSGAAARYFTSPLLFHHYISTIIIMPSSLGPIKMQ
jgi:hypothetical protein